MNTSFIRLGSLGLNIRDILSYDLNHCQTESYTEAVDGGIEHGHRSVSYVRIITCEQTYTDVGIDGWVNTSKEYLFKHGTPESNALIIWLTDHSEDLLRPHRFYVTVNLYGGHTNLLAEAAQAYNAQLVAVDYQDIRDIPQDQRGYHEARAYYLFSVPASSLDKAHETVEQIEHLAAMREEQ